VFSVVVIAAAILDAGILAVMVVEVTRSVAGIAAALAVVAVMIASASRMRCGPAAARRQVT